MAVIKHLDLLDHITSRMAPGMISDVSDLFRFSSYERKSSQQHYPSNYLFGSYCISYYRYLKVPDNHYRHIGCRDQNDGSIPLQAFFSHKLSKELPSIKQPF
uniref:Uncharacterized protein n=1 Tax=uncultured Desulfobacterium sp. TaxID=201089 RepID=E1YIX1_9BACT|nr:unknown protein [uncultured Desulfobacterium sp.]